MFLKMNAAFTTLSKTATVQSWEQKPSAIVEVTTIEDLRLNLENAAAYHKIIHRGKQYTAAEAVGIIGHIWNFYQS